MKVIILLLRLIKAIVLAIYYSIKLHIENRPRFYGNVVFVFQCVVILVGIYICWERFFISVGI